MVALLLLGVVRRRKKCAWHCYKEMFARADSSRQSGASLPFLCRLLECIRRNADVEGERGASDEITDEEWTNRTKISCKLTSLLSMGNVSELGGSRKVFRPFRNAIGPEPRGHCMFSVLSEHQAVSGSLQDRSTEAYKAVALWVEQNCRSDCRRA